MATTQTEVYRVTASASSNTLSTKLLQYRLQRLSTRRGRGGDLHDNSVTNNNNRERFRANEYLKVCKNVKNYNLIEHMSYCQY